MVGLRDSRLVLICTAFIHQAKGQVSTDVEAALKFPEDLMMIIGGGRYSPKQIFFVDEPGLFRKRMPSQTFIS
jgi:hypothetical protein